MAMTVTDSITGSRPDTAAVSPAIAHHDTVARPATRMATVIPYATNDSVAVADSVATAPKNYGVLLEAPVVPEVPRKESDSFGMSCILAGLFILFAVIGLRFRNNSKYVAALVRNLVEVRVRSNVFDETVRETSFIVLLNLMWSCSAGMVLCGLLIYMLPVSPAASFGIPALSTHPALCTAVCMGIMILYTCLMALAYFMVGTVFSDVVHARMWLKGFLASQGLLSVIFFPLALMLLYYPGWSDYILLGALGFLLLGKIVFIWKGFRIFFTQISSWVLFLYYLCSLEIVPLILTYWAACLLCSLL
ncbi:MAG: DUF4271 domain-containing protein [Bacteroides sp.]|nr:DUF4271 domain-containing protein [Bacteroides sp.]